MSVLCDLWVCGVYIEIKNCPLWVSSSPFLAVLVLLWECPSRGSPILGLLSSRWRTAAASASGILTEAEGVPWSSANPARKGLRCPHRSGSLRRLRRGWLRGGACRRLVLSGAQRRGEQFEFLVSALEGINLSMVFSLMMKLVDAGALGTKMVRTRTGTSPRRVSFPKTLLIRIQRAQVSVGCTPSG